MKLQRFISLTLAIFLFSVGALLQPAAAQDASNTMRDAIIQFYFRTGTPTKPTNLYIGLHTSTCTSVTEVSGGSYARVAVSAADASWAAPSTAGGGRQTSNVSTITYPSPTANWGTVQSYGVYDASTAGNMLICDLLTTNRTINNGDGAPSFAAGALTVTIK